MRERPILFKAPMIRAILDGRKSMTRRIIKPQPARISDAGRHSQYEWRGGFYALDMYPTTTNLLERLPWKVGDRAWVRETWACLDSKARPGARIVYRADTDDGERVRVDAPWRPAIHMPRWASRIDLDVTDVRVQRLQDISEEDAVAEGIVPVKASGYYKSPAHPDGKWRAGDNAHLMFRDLWNSTHGPGAWDANPWVAALSFRRVEGQGGADAATV